MIVFFPQLYPDELLYSCLARYYDKSGYGSFVCAAEDMFEQKIWKLDSLFLNRLTDDAVAKLEMQKSLECIIKNHTMYPYYVRFLPKERRRRALDSLLKMDGKHRYFLQMHQDGKSQDRYLRYCPSCVKADRQRYGETYWHRIHQMYGVDVCPVHGCYLVDSNVSLSSKKGLGLLSAESSIGDNEPVVCRNPLQTKLAKYVAEVFESEISDSGCMFSDFIHERFADTEYTSARGEAIRISKLYNDISTYYSSLPENPFSEKWRLEKVLQGSRFHTLEVAMISMFLGVEVADLVSHQKPKIIHTEWFDNRVRELHEQGLKYPRIAEIMGAPLDVVKSIGEDRYGVKEHVPRCSGGIKARDWKAIDKEMLPQVQRTIREIWGEDDARPHRITVHSVSRKLGFSERRFQNMPLCLGEIEKSKETYEQYWQREIRWAVQEIEKSGQPITLTAIRRKTNIKINDIRGNM